MFMLCCRCSSDDPGSGEAKNPLEGLVKNIIKNLGGKNKLGEEEILKAWEKAVGRKAAAHSAPASFKKSGLVITVDGSGWLYELTTKKREILKKLEAKLNNKKIKDIRFRIGEVKKRTIN